MSVVHRLRHEENASTTTCAKYRQDWIKIKESFCATIIINSKMHSFNFYEMLQKLDRTQSLQLCTRFWTLTHVVTFNYFHFIKLLSMSIFFFFEKAKMEYINETNKVLPA